MKSLIRFFAALTAVLMTPVLSGCGKSAEMSESGQTVPDCVLVDYSGALIEPEPPEGYISAGKAGYSALFLNPETADFVLIDLRSGNRWYSTPPEAENDEIAAGATYSELKSQILVTDVKDEDNTVANRNSYFASVQKGTFKTRVREDGFDVLYTFAEMKYSIPISYTVTQDGLRAEIDTAKIKEQGDLRVFKISLLPYFGAQRAGEEGFLLLSDGSGSVIDINSKRLSYPTYRSRIYGEDYITVADWVSSRREKSLLPVLGIQAGDRGAVAIIETGAALGEANGWPAKLSSEYAAAYFAFHVRQSQNVLIGNADAWNTKEVLVNQSGPIDAGKLTVRFVLTGPGEHGLPGMAAVVRNYLLNLRGNFSVSLQEQAPVNIMTLGAVKIKRSVLGIRMNATTKVTTFAEAAGMLEKLGNAGVKKANLIFDGYDKNQLSGKITDGVSLYSGMGGKKALSALADAPVLDNLYLTSELALFSKSAKEYSKSNGSTRDLNQLSYEMLTYKRNTFFPDREAKTNYLLKTRLSGKALDGFLADVTEFGGAGVNLGSYTNMVYSDFSDGGMARYLSEASVSAKIKDAAKASRLLGDSACWYALPGLSGVTNAPFGSANFDICDESVPFYQMVLHGLIPVYSRPVNNSGSPEDGFLECIRSGMIPSFQLVAGNTDILKKAELSEYYAAGFDYWQEIIARDYPGFAKVYAETYDQFITGYDNLGDGLTRTRYENGAEVWVNSSGLQRQTEDGKAVPARGYILTKGDAAK